MGHQLTPAGCLLRLAGRFLLSLCSNCSPAGVCTALQRGHNQDGREQPGHGDGPELSALPVRRPAHHLREHAQGDVLPANAHRPLGYQLYRGGGVDHQSPAGGIEPDPSEAPVKHYIHVKASILFFLCADHTGNCWLDISLL